MSVKTTIELPEGLVTEAKRKAVDDSTTLRELVIRGLEMVLYPKAAKVAEAPAPYSPGQTYRVDSSGWPVLESSEEDLRMTNEMVDKMREEMGI